MNKLLIWLAAHVLMCISLCYCGSSWLWLTAFKTKVFGTSLVIRHRTRDFTSRQVNFTYLRRRWCGYRGWSLQQTKSWLSQHQDPLMYIMHVRVQLTKVGELGGGARVGAGVGTRVGACSQMQQYQHQPPHILDAICNQTSGLQNKNTTHWSGC